jgi:hypothetical protein
MSSKASAGLGDLASIAVGCSALSFFADASKDLAASGNRPVGLRKVYSRLRAAYNEIPLEGTTDATAIEKLAKV